MGWSRGGTLGKVVTVRRPDLVASLVTLGTPNTDPLAVNATLAAQLQVITRLSALGVPGLLGEDCISGECAHEIKALLEQDVPDGIPYTARCSPSTTASSTGARASTPRPTPSRCSATHMSMGADPEVIEIVADLLAEVVPAPLS